MLTRDDLLRLIRERAHHPSSARELVQLLQVPREQRASFRRQLKLLAADGALVEVRGRRYGLADMMDLVVGRLQSSAGGFGFVIPELPVTGGGATRTPVEESVAQASVHPRATSTSPRSSRTRCTATAWSCASSAP